MILITLKVPVRADRAQDFVAIAQQYARDVSAEEGCLFFEWSRSLTDENVFVAVEGFSDGDAGAAHMKTEHVAAFFEIAPDYLADQPQIIYIDSPGNVGYVEMAELSPR